MAFEMQNSKYNLTCSDPSASKISVHCLAKTAPAVSLVIQLICHVMAALMLELSRYKLLFENSNIISFFPRKILSSMTGANIAFRHLMVMILNSFLA